MNSKDDNGYTTDDIFNDTFKNIKSVNYDSKNDVWIVDLNFNNIHDINYPKNSYNDENNKNETKTNENDFPNFNKFLKDKMFNKLVEDTENAEKEIYYQHNNLQRINYSDTINIMKDWTNDMVNSQEKFPTFMYTDMFLMRDYASQNISKNYIYISYFPSDIRSVHGAHYIAVAEVVPKTREFQIQLIVQNPNYMIEYDYDEKKIIKFKNQLITLCRNSEVFFEFAHLKHTSNPRYYYSWLYA